MAKPKNTSHSGAGQLRIIGGEWRSRKLDFPHVEGLRPTPDRVRETLFNWLAPYIGGARVLDVFAGSGALFLEAMSRGAAKGVALDSNRDAISNIRENMGILRCTVGQVQQAALGAVGAANEVGDEAVCGAQIDVFWRCELLDFTMGEHADAVGHGQRFALVVGDEQGGNADFALQAFELDLHLVAQGGIQVGQRLVKQQNAGARRN